MSTEDTREFELFLSDSCLYDYLRIIKSYKPATAKDNFAMIKLYRSGNEDMREEIINRNMALVVSVAYKLSAHLNAEEKLEYIQYGMIGLIDAIERYDPDKGAFSTCADFWIRKEMYKYKYNHQSLIRRSWNFLRDERKYRHFIKEYVDTGTPLPPREEICKALNITDDILTLIENDNKLNATSLDAPLQNDEKDSGNIVDFVSSPGNSYSEILDTMVLKEMMETFALTFSPHEYYIIYYRFINPEAKTLQEIGDYFGISKQAIKQIESKILTILRKMFDDDHNLKRRFVTKAKQNSQVYSIKTTPVTLEDCTLYYFLRDSLPETEQYILKQMLLSNIHITEKNIIDYTNQSPEKAKATFYRLKSLINKTALLPRYQLFSKVVINTYGKKLYDLESDADLKYYLDPRNIIAELWKDENVDELLETAQPFGDDALLKIINKFFGFAPIKEIEYNPNLLERDINYTIYGFAAHEVSISKLYPIFLANQDKFNETQRNHLLAYIFKKIPITNETDNLLYKDQFLIDRLLMLSYKTQDYKKDNFSKEKYLSIRKKLIETFSKREIQLLDLYYGVGQKRHTILEMATLLSEDKNQTEVDFRRAKRNAISIYLGENAEYWDKSIYSEVLKDESLKLLSPHKEIAWMFFIDGMTYEQILENYHGNTTLTQRKVSEYMKYACLVMDFHRFGITSTNKDYSRELLSQVLEESSYDETLKVTMRVFIKTKSVSLTALECKQSQVYVQNSARKIRALAYQKVIDGTDITKEDVQNAIFEHPSTNVLSERDKIILSMYYGLENEFNPSGKKSYPMAISERLEIKNNIGTFVRKAIERVKAHKVGFLKAPLDFIDRNELQRILFDVHLPLDDTDRDYIIDAYGLYGEEYLSFKQIAEKYGVREPAVRDRIYRSIVTIRKYQNKEIKGELYYPLDIEPYLKYFILEDREILKLIYRDKWPLVDIQKRFGLSSHQLQILLTKIRMHLDDLKQKKATGIDFDYFWDVALNDDIPFYGNRDLAVELCFLYYEKRITQADIVKYYHPELEDKAVSALIRDFTAAIIKRQNGIIKAQDFTYADILDYYTRHKPELTGVQDEIYQSYFTKIGRSGPHAKFRPNKIITFDLIKERYPDYFKLSEATLDDVRNVLEKYGHLFPEKIKDALESTFGVTHYSLLSDADVERLAQFIMQMPLSKDYSLVRKNDDVNPD